MGKPGPVMGLFFYGRCRCFFLRVFFLHVNLSRDTAADGNNRADGQTNENIGVSLELIIVDKAPEQLVHKAFWQESDDVQKAGGRAKDMGWHMGFR